VRSPPSINPTPPDAVKDWGGHWEHRVEQFKDRDFRNEKNFRQAKQELLANLRGLQTASCQRRVRREVDELIEETRAQQS
jgi:hypothetical protein